MGTPYYLAGRSPSIFEQYHHANIQHFQPQCHRQRDHFPLMQE